MGRKKRQRELEALTELQARLHTSLKAYLIDLREAVKTRVEWEYRDQLDADLDTDPLQRMSRLYALADATGLYGEVAPPPPIPEELDLFRVSSSMGLPYRQGGLEDQPYLLLQAFIICQDEERRVQNQVAVQTTLKAMQSASSTG